MIGQSFNFNFNKVFCLGEGKTGTTSLHQAFLSLGLRSIHHSPPGYKNTRELKENARLINDQITQCKRQGEQLLKHINHFDAYSDIWAIRTNFEVLDRQYPNSKFIYTERSLEQWIDSLRRHVARNIEAVGNNLYETKLISVEENKWIETKKELLAKIEAYFTDRPEDLLIIDITKGDGYEKLCPFLGLNIPETPFPKSNIGSEEAEKISKEVISLSGSDRPKNSSLSAQEIESKLNYFKISQQYSKIYQLAVQSIKDNHKELNKKIFGYLPRLFRQVVINKDISAIDKNDIFIDEPVIYKVYFPDKKTFCGIEYFYIFCCLKNQNNQLDVYFQSAAEKDRKFSQDQYNISLNDIGFEGIGAAFNDLEPSVISISDPGHYIPGFCSSFYVGTQDINFVEIITQFVEKIATLAHIKNEEIFLFGSSAGSLGALMSGSYFKTKVNVMAVNSQITLQNNQNVISTLLGIKEQEEAMSNFSERISCIHRFRQKTDRDVVPNIYIMANVNDELYRRNYNFYQLYQRRFSRKGIANQSFFDSYYGVEGHGRPNKAALKTKIMLAKQILSLKSN